MTAAGAGASPPGLPRLSPPKRPGTAVLSTLPLGPGRPLTRPVAGRSGGAWIDAGEP
jgi:hypothetical protein